MSFQTRGCFAVSAFQPSSGQVDEPQPELGPLSSGNALRVRKDNRGNKRVGGEGAHRAKTLLKVKFTKSSPRVHAKKSTNKDEPPARWILEPTRTTLKPPINPAEQAKSAGSDSCGGDEFFFSQRTPSNTTNEKDKARHAVLMTISRMLKENQLIRRRLASQSQAN